MKVLIKKAFIADSASPYFQQVTDILIQNGTIVSIASNINESADTVIELPNLYVSPGWVDSFANFADPGYEYKETLDTGAAAAAAGGFTRVMVIPNTKPAIDTKTQAQYIVQRAKTLPIDIIPIGAVTKNTEGKELAEMYDLQHNGAMAFSDGTQPIQTAGILLKALQYLKTFNGVIIQLPDDKSIAPHGLMNEGIVSTRLGLPGKPMMAEELMVARDIKLARYTNSRLHFTGISSPKSLEYIKRGREGGIQITCSVTPYHLAFCDEDLMTYDTNLKVNLPLRTRADMMALREAVTNETIDCIATHHLPQDWDSKTCEFEYANYGMIGLETTYPVLKSILPAISEPQWVQLLSANARKIFDLPSCTIQENGVAEITLFQPAKTFTYKAEQIRSKSQNSPFINKEFPAKVAGIIYKAQLVLNH
jgi:dihydroorotase